MADPPPHAPLLVAPAPFKGTLRAPEVAAALARGIEAGGRAVDVCPIADGGVGTLEVLLPALGGSTDAVDVDGRAVGVGVLDGGGTVVVELASVLGAAGMAESSAAAGELVLAAAATGAQVVLVGAGDVLARDGGAGAAEVLRAVGEIGAAIVVLCDVRTAVERVGEALAGTGTIEREEAFELGARVTALAATLPKDPRGIAYGGAGGGIAAAIWATCDARLVGGAPFVLEELNTDARMRAAHAVIVGEGRLDLGTLAGKAPAELATRARQSGIPSFAVVGDRTLDAFGARILDLQAVLEANDQAAIERAGVELVRLV